MKEFRVSELKNDKYSEQAKALADNFINKTYPEHRKIGASYTHPDWLNEYNHFYEILKIEDKDKK